MEQTRPQGFLTEVETATFELEVGEGLDAADLLDVLNEHADSLRDFLVGDEMYVIDSRATCNSISFDEVTPMPEGGRFHVSFIYGWSAYYGCRDRNSGGDEYGETEFIYSGGKVKFEKVVVPPRNTDEEF